MKKILNIRIKDIKGITLIALVITIIVLLILAAVAINLSLGNNGIFNRAKTAKEQYQNAESYEQTEIAKISNEVDYYTRGGSSSGYTETVLYENSAGAGAGTTVTFSGGHSVDEFDAITFLFGFNRNGGWDGMRTMTYTKSQWNYVIDNKNNTYDEIFIEYDERQSSPANKLILNNISKTGFAISSNECNHLATVIGIKY